ncbi:MAG: nuclear transport factor 2 family protein [Thermodesulfobacteriota bacterium]
MNERELEARVKALEEKLDSLQDVEEIKKLQRAYGFYLDNRLWDEVVALFSDQTESLEISDSGVYLGKGGVERFFKEVLGRGGLPAMPGALGIHMQLQGIVNVGLEKHKAKGRWQCVMLIATSVEGQLRALLGHGVYEVEYVKEEGIWRFMKLHFFLTFRTPLDEGWVKTPVVISMARQKYDLPTTVYKPYPAKYVVPFHYGHPVMGKPVGDTSENEKEN